MSKLKLEKRLQKLVSPKDAAEALSLSRRTLARYETSGKLTPVKINCRVTRYYLDEVMALQVP